MSSLQQQARALGDPTRHRIFRYIADARRPVTIAELTDHLGFNHNAIRQHLAKLAAAGLIVGQTVPAGGRGRPRLVYEVAAGVDSGWGVSGPYERLSRMLAEIVSSGESPVTIGRRVGQGLASPSETADGTVADITSVMARQGFEPEVRRQGRRAVVTLLNCPFREVALEHPDTVCALHLGIAEGLADAGGDVTVDELVVKNPRRAGCRLHLRLAV